MKIQRIRDHYTQRVHSNRRSSDILDWSSETEQEIRFDVLLTIMHRTMHRTPATPVTVLDVGCGMADLRHYLHKHDVQARYTGVDITPAIVAEAKRRQPEADLLIGDVFDHCPFAAQSFDFVFCSGLFNLDLGNNHQFVAHALPVLFNLCRQCAVANFLHVRTPQQHEHCCYYDPADLMAVIPSAVRRAELIDDYLEKDFTIAAARSRTEIE